MEGKYITAHIVEDGGVTKCILPSASFYDVKMNAGTGTSRRPKVDSSPQETVGILPYEKTSGYDWAPWGEDDCLPTTIREKLYSVPMAGRAIYQLVQMMYGNGIAYYNNRELQDGPKVSRAFTPKIESFLSKNRIATNWLPAQLIDYRFYMNCFSEMIFNNARNQITGIYHKKAEFSRLSVQNKKTGAIENLYYSPRFADGYVPTSKQIKSIQLFDWVNEDDFLNKITGWKFAWHSYFPTPGTDYYARPLWLGLFAKDGWIDVSASVPKIISSMQHNQLRLKYHILIPESYFEIRYSDWQGMTDKKRNAKIDQLITNINSSLRGVDNIYSSIATVYREDHNTRQPVGKIEIIPVDNKIKESAWVPSSDKADAQIVQGLGLHPSQVGLSPQGGKMGAGSGSDQRESFNTGITLNTMDQLVVLEPLNWIARFNAQTDPDWDVTFFIDHTYHTTTNNEESGMVESNTTIQPK